MLNYNMHSKKIIFICVSILSLLTGCNPLKEKPAIKSIVEMEYTDPELAQQSSQEPDQAISGNLSIEVQEDLESGKKTVYASASFYESTEKNVLFDNIPTKELAKNTYKPKPPPPPPPPPPVDPPPCGIPGFPDCPATKQATN